MRTAVFRWPKSKRLPVLSENAAHLTDKMLRALALPDGKRQRLARIGRPKKPQSLMSSLCPEGYPAAREKTPGAQAVEMISTTTYLGRY